MTSPILALVNPVPMSDKGKRVQNSTRAPWLGAGWSERVSAVPSRRAKLLFAPRNALNHFVPKFTGGLHSHFVISCLFNAHPVLVFCVWLQKSWSAKDFSYNIAFPRGLSRSSNPWLRFFVWSPDPKARRGGGAGSGVLVLVHAIVI